MVQRLGQCLIQQIVQIGQIERLGGRSSNALRTRKQVSNTVALIGFHRQGRSAAAGIVGVSVFAAGIVVGAVSLRRHGAVFLFQTQEVSAKKKAIAESE